MNDERPEFGYSDQPYLAPLVRCAERLAAKRKRGVFLTIVEHNGWCPA